MNQEFKFKEIEGKKYIFDSFRSKYVVLTPEEWVRQNFLNYLVIQKKYPKKLIKLESGLKYNKLNKRSDILVYNRQGKPFLLVECKAQEVPIDQKVIEQISRYNLIIKATFCCVTNGLKSYCFQTDFENNKTSQIHEVPDLI